MQESKSRQAMDRRTFLASASAAGAGLALAQTKRAKAQTSGSDDLNIAVIGLGEQGRVLINSFTKIPGIRCKAACDIWSYSQQYGTGQLKKAGHPVTLYEDYRELLATETDLDAAIVATPDWMHAEHAIACMEAGLHVYCEKEMSNSLEKARQMVLTSRKTGKLLQIGHQRRSNPRYIHAIDNLIHKEALLGRVTQAYGQWNRGKSEDLGTPRKHEMDAATLEKYGYATMSQFRNWRWYRKYGGGPIVDLGSHQIDIFSWVFGTDPKSVMASGGVDFYQQHEWFDNVMVIYEFENELGTSRAMYQVLTTTGHGSFYETFMGVDGTIELSEVPERGNSALREPHTGPEGEARWNEVARQGGLIRVKAPIQVVSTKNINTDVRASVPLGSWPLSVQLFKPAHQPHLENFFDAIRLGKPLNCPGEVGYETAVAVLKVNEAVEAGRKIDFKPEDFHA